MILFSKFVTEVQIRNTVSHEKPKLINSSNYIGAANKNKPVKLGTLHL